jgi:hypothetical protein
MNKYLVKIAEIMAPKALMSKINTLARVSGNTAKKMSGSGIKNNALLADRLKASNRLIEKGMQP